jgi:type IV pilus assembly protein PilM
MGFFSSTNRAVGLDLGSRYIKAVEVEGGSVPEITGFACERVTEQLLEKGEIKDLDALFRFLDRFLNSNGMRREKIVVSLDGHNAQMQIEEFPVSRASELDSTIKYWIRENIGGTHVPFAHHQLEHYVDDVGGSIYSVLFVWAERNVVTPYDQLFAKLKFSQSLMNVDLIATINGLDVSGDFGAMMTVDGGALTTNLTIFDGGSLKYLKTIPSGIEHILQNSESTTGLNLLALEEQLKETGFVANSTETFQQELKIGLDELIQRIATELKIFSRKNKGIKVDRIFLTGGISLIRGVDKLIAETFDFDVHTPTMQMTQGKTLPEETAQLYTTALGLALHGVQ